MQLAFNEFIDEQRKGLNKLLADMRKTRVAAARTAARESAARIKSLNVRVRALARSGVGLTTVSQNAAQSLIELQADIVNSALGEAATRLERMAYTESVRDLARMQGEVLQAARERIVADMARTLTILKDAAGGARKAMGESAEPAAARPRKARKKAGPRRKAKPKAKATGRKVKAKATTRAKARAPAKAKARTKAKARVKAPARARTRQAARKTARRR